MLKAILLKILSLYINSSIHVALAVVSFSFITLKQNNLAYSIEIFIFIFSISIGGYNIIKHIEKITINILYYKIIGSFTYIVTLIGFIAFLSTKNQIKNILNSYSWIAIVLSIGYIFPFIFLKNKSKRGRIRDLGWGKVMAVAIVWSIITVYLPIIWSGYELPNLIHFQGLARVFLVIALMIPFELRDMQTDNLALKTIPQKIGIPNTKIIGYICLVLHLITILYIDFTNLYYTEIFMSLFCFFFIFKSETNQSTYYSSFWVESIPILGFIVCHLGFN